MAKVKLCCFCRTPLKDREANNAEPARVNRICCDRCNAEIVVPYRMLCAISGRQTRNEQAQR